MTRIRVIKFRHASGVMAYRMECRRWFGWSMVKYPPGGKFGVIADRDYRVIAQMAQDLFDVWPDDHAANLKSECQ